MAFLDLEALPRLGKLSKWFSIEKFSWFSFYRKDYHGDPKRSLQDCVRETIHQKTGIALSRLGKVFVLTQLRTCGFIFNPVSFYYVQDVGSKHWIAFMAEINNTPWNERYSYAFELNVKRDRVPCATVDDHDESFRKDFHVSPFMPMDQDYRWRFSDPSKVLSILMENTQDDCGKLFEAELKLKRQPFTSAQLMRQAILFPFTTIKTIVAIYFHALRLKLKGVTYFEHPKNQKASYVL
jgi:DUF1365 family protein